MVIMFSLKWEVNNLIMHCKCNKVLMQSSIQHAQFLMGWQQLLNMLPGEWVA